MLKELKQLNDLCDIGTILFKNARSLYPGEEAPAEVYFAKKSKKILEIRGGLGFDYSNKYIKKDKK